MVEDIVLNLFDILIDRFLLSSFGQPVWLAACLPIMAWSRFSNSFSFGSIQEQWNVWKIAWDMKVAYQLGCLGGSCGGTRKASVISNLYLISSPSLSSLQISWMIFIWDCQGVISQSTGFCYTTPRPKLIFAREHVKNEMVQ